VIPRRRLFELRWLAAAGLAGGGLLIGCGEPPAEWHEEGTYRWRELQVRGAAAGFTRMSPSRTGVRFINRVPAEVMYENRNLAHGTGVALGDVDGDGRPDLYFPSTLGTNALYRNRGNWRFEDISQSAGVALPDRLSRGSVMADVDGDGDLDLLVSIHAGRHALLVNDGTGSFADHTADSGFEKELATTTFALADVDGDGDLDLYAANNKNRVALDLFSPGERSFENMTRLVDDQWVVVPEFREHYRVELVGTILQRFELAEPDEFYLNDGSGRFTEVPLTGGRFLDRDGAPLSEPPREWGLTAHFHDMNGDGDPDLYVANDFNSPDLVYLNRGDGTFQEADILALRKTSLSSMAVDFSDIDRDGDIDFITTDMLSRDSRRRRTQVASFVEQPAGPGQIEFRPQVNRNNLQLGRGDGTFAEMAHYAGLEASDWNWGNQFLDVDLDGYEDLLFTTGHPWDQLDADTHMSLRMAGSMVDWRTELGVFPPLPLENVAFKNRGDLTFQDATDAWGFGGEKDMSHGIGSADLDGDGDLDVVVARMDAEPVLYRNDAGAPRVAVRLRGAAPNTQAIGARITLRGPGLPIQTKEVTAGGMYLSGSDPAYSFAAAPEDTLTLEIQWRSGRRTEIRGVRANRYYEVEEPAADDPGEAPAVGDAAPPDAAPAPDPAPVPGYFVDVSDQLAHTHVERPFDEFARQPLVPFRLSQLGPGVTWQDVDRDGDEDLLIGSGAGGRLGFFRNDAGTLNRVTLRAPEADFDQSTILGFANGAGGMDLLVGQMNYEAATPRAATATPSVLRLDLGSAAGRSTSLEPRIGTAVPGQLSTVGPLALADIDGDGDLDLFVGGRVEPAAYPRAPVSRFFRNESGSFMPDEDNSQAVSSVGMVSAAVFSDVDADGDPDLLLAIEWGPVRLLLNEEGRFRDVTEEWGLDRYRGRWNGVATGDFNADGLPDLVATGWGENTGYRVSPDRPLFVYYADLDNNGTLEVIEAQHDDRLDGLVPLHSLSALNRGFPHVLNNTPTHADFADATLEEVIGPALPAAGVREASVLSHTVFLNRGGRFEATRLPTEAQLSPSFFAGVADFDGDGNEDLFLTQNFFASGPDSERFDAGRSLWLRGDGAGRFEPVPGPESGVKVYGDPRGAGLADFDGDGRVDLAVSQNGAATRLFRNVGARPGLRVRLVGPADNPDATGASIRVIYQGGRMGPVREVQAGSGYWSRNGSIQVLGLSAEPAEILIRWPGGAESRVPVPPGGRELDIRMP
jgi:hypothetical protein